MMSAKALSAAPLWLGGKPLVFASHNKGKVAEIREMIGRFAIEVMDAGQMNLDEPEETGATFRENAELKAKAAMIKSGMVALADDSGLAVNALGGAPGVYSARWAGEDKNFTKAFERIRNELKESKTSDFSASFICMLCLCFPNGETMFFEGKWDGKLVFPPRGTNGFGYDPIFIPDGYDITCAEMTATEKNTISHRARAFNKFVEFLQTT